MGDRLSDPAQTIPLRNSQGNIPVLGLGVFEIDPADTTATCERAIAAGYRQIDTAQLYNNEAEVGAATASCGLSRGELFVTTKIRYPRVGKGKTYLRTLQSVEKIDPSEKGYVDLFLIHTPKGVSAKDRKEMWLALEKLHDEGKAKAIGVSNYSIEDIESMKQYAKIWPPVVNQIELHPWRQQRELVEYCRKHDIMLQAFSPLARGAHMSDDVLLDIARRCGKSPGQVLIRYGLQKGWVPLPKSQKEERITENVNVFDFAISEDDMSLLDAQDG